MILSCWVCVGDRIVRATPALAAGASEHSDELNDWDGQYQSECNVCERAKQTGDHADLVRYSNPVCFAPTRTMVIIGKRRAWMPADVSLRGSGFCDRGNLHASQEIATCTALAAVAGAGAPGKELPARDDKTYGHSYGCARSVTADTRPAATLHRILSRQTDAVYIIRGQTPLAAVEVQPRVECAARIGA